MSSSVMLMFEKGEIGKVKEWFNIVCPEDRYPDLPVPCGDFREDIERGIYVTFSKNIMVLDTAIWDDMGGCFATHIGQELGKKFKIKKAGWDSVGYCTKDFMKASGLLAHFYRKNLEKWKANNPNMDFSAVEKDIQDKEEAEKFYREEAKKLVKGR